MYNNSNGRPSQPPALKKPESLEARFQHAPGWVRWGLIGVSGLAFLSSAVFVCALVNSAFSQPASQPTAETKLAIPSPLPTPSASASPSPTASPMRTASHYPPAIVVDLFALAAKGDASTIHEFHSEDVGLATCPQPKREVTVDASLAGQQLAEDLLAYYYAQKLDNTCGTAVFAYHNQSEAGDAYTAGRILVNVTDSSGAANLDPNASNLTHKLTLDIGGIGMNQEYIVTY